MLSRDEFHPDQQGFKPVLGTVITHPSELHHITFELRGPPGQSPTVETLRTTGPHPFYVLNRAKPGFYPAQELVPGDLLSLSEHTSATVTGNSIQLAQLGGSFTTYNFEVAGYHTYFVGKNQVWVHNVAQGLCKNLFVLTETIAKKHPQRFGKRFDILEEAALARKAENKAIDASTGNHAIHAIGREELKDYAANHPTGGGDLSKAPGYTKQRDMRDRLFGGADKYEVHHLCEKRVSEALGIDELKWDDCPAINLPEGPPPGPSGYNGKGFTQEEVDKYKELWNGQDPIYHKGPDGIATAIRNEMNELGLNANGPNPNVLDADKDELIKGLRRLYVEDPRFKELNAWPAVRDWLRKELDGKGLTIPN